jgi:GxxExxY protein
MNTDKDGYLDSLTERVLAAVFEVSNTLGAGFLEKVYERALLRELTIRGIRAAAQTSLAVTYKGHNVGEYCADILVEDALVIELKCGSSCQRPHRPMHQLSSGLRPPPVPSGQFSKAQSRMEAHHAWVSGFWAD